MAPKPGVYTSADKKITRQLTDPGEIVNAVAAGWTRNEAKSEKAAEAAPAKAAPAKASSTKS
jgi:hypothetical protein